MPLNMKPYDYNTYFIIQLPEPALNAILTHCVEKTINNVRVLYDGSYVVKLPMYAIVPPVLQSKKTYTHSEILEEIKIREAGRSPI